MVQCVARKIAWRRAQDQMPSPEVALKARFSSGKEAADLGPGTRVNEFMT
jgi:hypothetical protein